MLPLKGSKGTSFVHCWSGLSQISSPMKIGFFHREYQWFLRFETFSVVNLSEGFTFHQARTFTVWRCSLFFFPISGLEDKPLPQIVRMDDLTNQWVNDTQQGGCGRDTSGNHVSPKVCCLVFYFFQWLCCIRGRWRCASRCITVLALGGPKSRLSTSDEYSIPKHACRWCPSLWSDLSVPSI